MDGLLYRAALTRVCFPQALETQPREAPNLIFAGAKVAFAKRELSSPQID